MFNLPSARRNRFRSRPQTSRRVTRRTPIESEDGGTQTETVTTTNRRRQTRTERRTPIPTGGSQTEVITSDTGQQSAGNRRGGLPNPVRSATKTSAGVGLLEAEFLGSLLLLIMLLFADTSKSYADKVMSTMKRGTFVALLFFILALMAGVGPNAAKIAKAIGALIFITIILTSPVTTVIGAFDTFAKQDWTSTNEHGTDVGSTSNTSDTGGSVTGGTAGPLQAASGAVQRITQIIESFGFGIIK